MPSPPTIAGTGFVPLQDYLNANRDTLANGFSQINEEAQGDVQGAQQFAGAGQEAGATSAGQLAAQTGSESGLAGKYGGPGGAFDASLMWAQYGPQLQSLSQYLGQHSTVAADQPSWGVNIDSPQGGQSRNPMAQPPSAPQPPKFNPPPGPSITPAGPKYNPPPGPTSTPMGPKYRPPSGLSRFYQP